MMKLGGRCTVQKSRPSSNLAVIAPPRGAHPQNVALGYDVGKITAGCLFVFRNITCDLALRTNAQLTFIYSGSNG